MKTYETNPPADYQATMDVVTFSQEEFNHLFADTGEPKMRLTIPKSYLQNWLIGDGDTVEVQLGLDSYQSEGETYYSWYMVGTTNNIDRVGISNPHRPPPPPPPRTQEMIDKQAALKSFADKLSSFTVSNL